MSTIERETETAAEPQTIVGAFPTEAAALVAVRELEAAGFPPDHVGVVMDNVRQAREVAGAYSPQGAIVGALIGVLLIVAFLVFGDDSVRANGVSVALGGAPIVGGLAFIGWLAGRARVWKDDEYEEVEDEVAEGEKLVSVLCDTADGADQVRAIFERAGAHDIRFEDTAEAV
jgi:hypothetical protein